MANVPSSPPMAVPDGSVIDDPQVGARMHALIAELYPLCRSLTGEGIRQTLAIVRTHLPLDVHHVASGTAVFDWTVPPEWNIRDAYIANAAGARVVDFRQSNLHVVGYSVPVDRRVTLQELKQHLFTLPETPDWIPYRTSYFKRDWGFCVTHRQFEALTEPEYHVCIDATLADGFLTYGECRIPGSSDEEVLIWCHACHPSLCNDNLSGIAVAVALGEWLRAAPRRYSYRLVFSPGGVGAITWLSRHATEATAIKHGLVLACIGDAGHTTYKRSRRGDAEIDRAVAHVLRHSGAPFEIEAFSPYGYDERQFCSPGFNLAVGRLTRTPHGRFPEYHTSADNLTLVTPDALADSLRKCVAVLGVLEGNRTYVNQNPWCEPQLGKRGLYEGMGASADRRQLELALLWVLNQSDGTQSLLDIAERSGLPFALVQHGADLLLAHDLLRAQERPAPIEAPLRT
jgi:aminopeptidase-like protein